MGQNQNIKKEFNYMDKNKLNENIIIATILVKENNSKQRIINSYENAKREEPEPN